MENRIDIALADEPLSADFCSRFVADEKAGGIALFIGNVRNASHGKAVLGLSFESYDSMALAEMNKIAEEAFRKWPLVRLAIHHRKGELAIGDSAVVIAVSAVHRDEAFQACRFCIDELKRSVPIWKKEHFEDGDVWVAAHP